jgi:hypothetical protein
MATIDWPAGLIPQAAELSLRKAGAQFASPFNGTLQAVDFIAERWVLSCSLAPQFQHDPRGVGVFANLLAGGVERVRVWPFHTGGAPRGSLRGAPTLGLATTRGATSLTLANATGGSVMLGGSFEFDTNADGRADGWAAVTIGSVTSVVYTMESGGQDDGAFEQGMSANYGALGTSHEAGVERGVQGLAPGPYTFLANVRGDPNQSARIAVEWRNSGGSIIGGGTVATIAVTGTPTRFGATSTAPAGTTQCTVRLLTSATGATGTRAVRWDVCAIKPGAVDLTWPGAATLLAGDFIGAGGQLFMVAANCTANDAGALVVPVINRARGVIASASAVTWLRPTVEMVLPAMQAGPVRRPGVIESTALDLVEVW